MDLKESDILGDYIDQHWYYRSKSKAMMRLISDRQPSVILDVGAGSGYFSKRLLANTSASEAWCVDTEYKENSDSRESGKPLYYRTLLRHSEADLVLLMDVLEHVDDDAELLRSYVQMVPHGTRFLISVPAFQFLWSGHDIFLGHRRRYTLNQVEGLVKRCGLTVQIGAYYFGAVLPVAASVRLVGNWLRGGGHKVQTQLSRHHTFVNEVLAAISRAEIPFLPYNRLGGLTVFCLGEKL